MKKLCIVLLAFSSCAPVYVPNIRNTPLFGKAGEFQGTFQVGNGIDGQAAVSITNNLGVMGSISYANRSDLDEPDHYHYHKFYEGGIGYYQNDEKLCYEIFAGYGWGEGSSFDEFEIFGSGDEVRASGKFERFFIQPALGFNKKIMHVSFSSRISFVNMYEFVDETNSIVYPESDFVVFVEPAVVGRVNVADRRVFFTFQAGASASITGQKPWDHRPFQWGMGMGFRIGGLHDEE